MRKTTFPAVISTFLFCYLFWVLITWSFELQELLAGVVVSLGVALFSARFLIHDKAFWFFNPAKLFGLIVYSFVFIWELIKSNVNVAKIVFGGCKNINPGIVKIPVGLKSDYGRAMLANSITMTPGTITVETVEEGEQSFFYVHWLDVKSSDPDEAAEQIKGTLERSARRVFK